MNDRDDLRREEYEADNPMCRAHRRRECPICDDRLDEDEIDADE